MSSSVPGASSISHQAQRVDLSSLLEAVLAEMPVSRASTSFSSCINGCVSPLWFDPGSQPLMLATTRSFMDGGLHQDSHIPHPQSS